MKVSISDHLVNRVSCRSFVRYTAFDAFGDELLSVFLEVTVLTATFHRSQGAHAAVFFVAAALVDDRFARAFFRAGQEVAHHDDVAAGSDGFGHITGIFDAAVGDDGDTIALSDFSTFIDGCDLRYADTSDDTGRADGARADADFDSVDATFDEGFRSGARSDVAGDDREVRIHLLDFFQRIEDAQGMAVSRIDDDDVDFGSDEGIEAVRHIMGYADSSGDQEAAITVFGRVRVFRSFFDILDGNEALQVTFFIDKG